MENHSSHFGTFFWRITAAHMLTYFLMGIIASNVLNYEAVFNNSETLRSFDSPWIPAGPILQVIRGFVFALALWYFREVFLETKRGWLKLWGLLIGLIILSTASAPPGSIEGFIYTAIPWKDQVKGYIEVVPQTGLFAWILCYWYAHPQRWINVLFIVLISLISLMSMMGVLANLGLIVVD